MYMSSKSQNMKIKSGFTLVETLVAISILLMAVVAPLVLLAADIQGIFSVKNKITALYLAEDAVDFMKYRLETNLNAQTKNGTSNPAWTDDPVNVDSLNNECAYNLPGYYGCIIDSFNNTIQRCSSSGCPILQIDPVSGAYGYSSGWTNTQFTRTVKFNTDSGTVPTQPTGPDPSADHEGGYITVIVSWNERGAAKQITLTGYAYDWYGYLPYPTWP